MTGVFHAVSVLLASIGLVVLVLGGLFVLLDGACSFAERWKR